MGLSNEERTEKIYFSLWRMTESDRLARVREEFPDIAVLLDKLWPAMLGGRGNGVYWLLGSGADNEVMKGPTLFSVAICGNRTRDRKDGLDQLQAERRAELEAEPDSKEKRERLAHLDLCDYQCDYRPNLHKVLWRNARALADVYELFEECENIRYALNRYKDEFAAWGKDLDSLVANILGRCFNAFTTDSRFREAWYTTQIANRIMYQRTEADSTIVKFWKQSNLHHDVGIGVHDLDELHDYWAKIQQKQTLTTEERVLATLWLLQRRFHYDHQFNDLLALLVKHNKAHPKDRVNLDKVKRLFNTHNKPAYVRAETRNDLNVEFCRLSEKTVVRDWSTKKAKKKTRKK